MIVKKLFLFILYSVLINQTIQSQVYAGSDFTICKCDGNTRLNGKYTGDPSVCVGGIKYKWTSVPVDNTLLKNDEMLSPNICPQVNTTYTLTIDGSSDDVKVGIINTKIYGYDAAGAEKLIDYTKIGRWGKDVGAGLDGYDAQTTGVGATANIINTSGTNTFIEKDDDRFFIEIEDPFATGTTIVAKIGTIKDYDAYKGAAADIDDDMTEVTLTETPAGSKKFRSESHLLVTLDLAVTTSDDDYAVKSAHSAAAVADDAKDDRTHRVKLNGGVIVEYQGCKKTLPVYQRTPTNEIKTVYLKIHVFKEPNNPAVPHGHIEINGDATKNTILGSEADAKAIIDRQLLEANALWAQAGIKFEISGAIDYQAEAKLPVPVGSPAGTVGVDILADGKFNGMYSSSFTTDDKALLDKYKPLSNTSTIEVFYVPAYTAAGLISRAYSMKPGFYFSKSGDNLFMIVGCDITTRLPSTNSVAHELGHILTNTNDSPNPPYIFYPSNVTPSDGLTPNKRRRLLKTTIDNARTVKTTGVANKNSIGNTVLK